MAGVVLVTGASRPLGARVVTALRADPGVARVVTTGPADASGPADLSGDRFADVIAAERVDTVVHLDQVHAPDDAGGRVAMQEINVIGAMRLFAACQRSAGVARLVVGSTTKVYGASPADPAVFTEETPPRGRPQGWYARDATEVEGYVRDLRERRDDLTVTILRLADVVGPGIGTPLTRYLEQPVVPVPLGRDPRLQFLHADDAVTAIRRMAVADHPGVFNVAGRGALTLSQALRRSGRGLLRVPGPGLRLLGGPAARVGLHLPPADELALLCHGRVVDTAAIERELGWVPEYSTAEAFDAVLGSSSVWRPV